MNRFLPIPILLFAFLASAAYATGFFPGDSMPPLTDEWAPNGSATVQYTTSYKLARIKWLKPSNSSPPPPVDDTVHIESFFDVFVELNIDGAPTLFDIPDVEIEFILSGVGQNGGTRTFNNELTQMLIPATSDMLIRESPTLASTGETTITDIGSGMYRIDSFFDVFTELSIDGGQTWIPGDSSMRLDLTPEPATILILGLGGLLLRKRDT